MPDFAPFPGIRYAGTKVRLDDVVAPPYDVISDDERRTLVGRSPSNAVRVELPEEEGGQDRYSVAARLMREWLDAGILVADPEPALYGYRMSYADESGTRRTTVGAIGALALEPPGSGILPHEQTMPKPKGDRLDLLRATGTNLSPIWALTASPGIAEAVEASPGPGASAVDDDGVSHELWPVTDPAAIGRIRDAVAAGPVVVADGHHRYETACAYQAETGSPSGDAGAGAVMALVVELDARQLSVRAIHRLVAGLPDGFDVVGALGEWFDLSPTTGPDPTLTVRMNEAGALGVVTRDGTWLAVPRPATDEAADQDLDSCRLDVALAGFPAHLLTYQHGWDHVAAAVATGRADAGILLRPATVDQIAATGRGGRRMPPKTTFFWPKPRTGMVFRRLA